MVAVVQDKKIYEFGDFRLIPGEGLLLRNGDPVSLQPKVLSLLILLVERHGHLVTKAELIDSVWGDAFIEEGVVSKAVWFVRNALGDATKEKFIQTVPKSGYRFVAPVSVLNDPSEASALKGAVPTGYRLPGPLGNGGSSKVAVDRAKTEAPQKVGPVFATHPIFSRSRALAVYAGIAAVLLVGVGMYLTLSGRSLVGKGNARRIAVLPLKPLDLRGGDLAYDLGIAEALILKLGSDKRITVRRLDAVRGYVDSNRDPIEVGKEEQVDYVLSANYQLANGKIKVTAQLTSVGSGTVEADYTATSESNDVFSAQDIIANDIGNKVLGRFGSDPREFRPKRGTNNEDAYRSYQQAMTLLDQQRPGSIPKAREYLDRAVELDPAYAKAWAGKAFAYSVMWAQGRPSDPEDPREIYARSMEAAKKALAIDPNLSDAYTSLCENRFAYELNPDGAETDCKRAIDLDPNSPPARRLYSMLLTSRGRSDEAFAEIKTAMELEPVSLRNQRIYANALYYARRYGEAIEVYKRLFDLNPEAIATHLYLIRSLERSGRESEALEILINLLVLEKKDDATIERIRAAYRSSGWRGVLIERINIELREKSPQYSVVAEHYGLLGDKQNAFDYLEKNLPKRHWMKLFFRVDPRFDPLRDDPRFDDLARRVEANDG